MIQPISKHRLPLDRGLCALSLSFASFRQSTFLSRVILQTYPDKNLCTIQNCKIYFRIVIRRLSALGGAELIYLYFFRMYCCPLSYPRRVSNYAEASTARSVAITSTVHVSEYSRTPKARF